MPRRAALPLLLAFTACMPPSWGAAALLHPARRAVGTSPALAHVDLAFEGEGGVPLRGWRFPPAGTPTGVTVVWLHGIADTRSSGTWIAERLVPRGFEVLAWDARAHGDSGGAACTYGVLEKRDLSRALDAAGARRVVLVGHSLGAAVALQAAAEDARVEAVVAISPFSDVESIARERAPWFASEAQIREALAIAEREGGLRTSEASPVAAARRIQVPVLLVHGADDGETRPAHSRRILAALAGPKELRLLPGVGHDDAAGRAWADVQAWILARFPPVNPRD